jgi:4-hydroxy-tetrahydrodipicolinate synthase
LIHVKSPFKALAKKRANEIARKRPAAQLSAREGKRNENAGSGPKNLLHFAVVFSPSARARRPPAAKKARTLYTNGRRRLFHRQVEPSRGFRYNPRMKKPAPARGVWPAAATPFRPDLSIDFDLYIAHCRELLKEGAHGLAALGTTSEANSLDFDERRVALEKLVAAGIPADKLLPGTGAPSIGDAVKLTKHAVDLGCRGVLLLPPYYYKGVSDDGLFAFVTEVIKRVNDPRLSLYLYNFPQMSAIAWSPDLIGRLLQAFPETIIGLKDSSGDVAYQDTLLKRFPGFAVFPASEALLLAALGKGAAGCISASANVNAAQIGALYDTWKTADVTGLNKSVTDIRLVMQKFNAVAGVKAVLADRYNAPDWARTRPPLVSLTTAQSKELLSELKRVEAKELV